MPSRFNCIIRCSCGEGWGHLGRAVSTDEEIADAESKALAAQVPRMVRHWKLSHVLSLGELAPSLFLAVIAEAARRVAAARGRGLPPVTED